MAKAKGQSYTRQRREKTVFEKNREELLKYPEVAYWASQLAPTTQKHVLDHMAHFVRITGKTPPEFLKWHRETNDGVKTQQLLDSIAPQVTDHPKTQQMFKFDMRGFLRAHGLNNLPKMRVREMSEWHRGYRREEIAKFVDKLRNDNHRLFAYIAIESGLRAQMILDIKYGYIREDYERWLRDSSIGAVTIRFPKEVYHRAKAAGFTCLGPHSLEILRRYLEGEHPERGHITDETRILPFQYISIYTALDRAKRNAKIEPKIQVLHGFRKYFDNAVNQCGEISEDDKDILKGRFGSTAAKSYTERGDDDRAWDHVREVYLKAHRYIDWETGVISAATLQSEAKLIEERARQREESLERRIQGLEKTIANLVKLGEESGTWKIEERLGEPGSEHEGMLFRLRGKKKAAKD